MNDETLKASFATEIPHEVAERGLPFAVKLALTAAMRGSSATRPMQLFALETIEDAVVRGVAGISSKDLHILTGALNPFGIVLRQDYSQTVSQEASSGAATKASSNTRVAAFHITAIASDAISGRNRFTVALRALVERGLATGNVYLASEQNLELVPSAPILLQRQLTLPPAALAALKSSNCRLVHDIDDLLWAIPAGHPDAARFTLPVVAAMEEQLACADIVTVSTQALAEALRKRGHDSFVLPNVLDPRDWSTQPKRADRTRPRVGWYANRSFGTTEFALLEQVVLRLINEADFVFLGQPPGALIQVLRGVQCHAAVPPAQFPEMLAALDLDIVLEPLADDAFTECKSNIRLLHAGILGYAVVASDIEPHRSLPVTRLPNNAGAWIEAIRHRIREPVALRDEGELLRSAVHQRFMANDWLETYLALWTGRSAAVVHAQDHLSRVDQVPTGS